ncbi:hypothetical protein RB195_014627 [Necator americanus]|uniref:G-protein coupled receptors family 1 profile domain-containing protein n=1 Tax=Necator americanus TaxID=51031 RepID=A0ABR1E2N0_NECAM
MLLDTSPLCGFFEEIPPEGAGLTHHTCVDQSFLIFAVLSGMQQIIGVLEICQATAKLNSKDLVTIPFLASAISSTLIYICLALEQHQLLIDERSLLVLGSINFSTMATLFYVTVVIYINRLIIIVFHRFSQHLFSKSNEKLILASILLSFLTILVLFLLPEVDNFYDSRYLMWLAPSNQETVKVLITYKDTLMFFAVLTGNICYITIIAFLLLTAKDRRAGFDKVVTLQASFILVYNTSSYAYWSFIHVRLFHCDLNARFISALFWALANGINPFLYLVVNSLELSFIQGMKTVHITYAISDGIIETFSKEERPIDSKCSIEKWLIDINNQQALSFHRIEQRYSKCCQFPSAIYGPILTYSYSLNVRLTPNIKLLLEHASCAFTDQ